MEIKKNKTMTTEQEKKYKIFLSLIEQALNILINDLQGEMEEENEEFEIEEKIDTLSDILGL